MGRWEICYLLLYAGRLPAKAVFFSDHMARTFVLSISEHPDVYELQDIKRIEEE